MAPRMEVWSSPALTDTRALGGNDPRKAGHEPLSAIPTALVKHRLPIAMSLASVTWPRGLRQGHIRGHNLHETEGNSDHLKPHGNAETGVDATPTR